MRQIVRVIMVATVTGIAALIVAMLVEDPHQLVRPADAAVLCPLHLERGRGDTARDDLVEWLVAASHGPNTPDVRVQLSEGELSVPRFGPSCVLRINRVPRAPFDGVDWRLGHIVDGVAPGTPGRFSVQMRASTPIRFDSATVYAYDGVSSTGRPVRELDEEWRELAFDLPANDGATTLEIWIRLTIEGAISNRGTVYVAAPRLEFAEAPWRGEE